MASRQEKPHLKIRRARISDASQIASLSGQLGYPATRLQVKARLARILPLRQHAIFAAESSSKKVIGWAHVSVQPLVESEIRAELHGLVVAENARSMGAGAELLDAAEDWARAMGCRAVSVRSNILRDRAHQFYERKGYQHYKTQKAFRKIF